MTRRSTLRPCAGVRYSELDGEAVLYEPITRAVHRLSPAGAAVWSRFDGRPLVPDGTAEADVAPTVELARRLRALRLIEDAPPDDAPPDGVADAGVSDASVADASVADAGVSELGNGSGSSNRDDEVVAAVEIPVEAEILHLPGRLVWIDGRRTLVLDPRPDPDPDVADVVVSVDLDRTTLVPTVGGEPVGAVLVVEPDGDQSGPLVGVDALRAIAERLPAAWFAPDDALDRLADLVDAVPVTIGRGPPA